MSSVRYTDNALVQQVKETPFPNYGYSSTGYGFKMPTRHMVKYNNRWHRVYAMCYGNAASVYIVVKGEDLFLDSATEYNCWANQ